MYVVHINTLMLCKNSSHILKINKYKVLKKNWRNQYVCNWMKVYYHQQDEYRGCLYQTVNISLLRCAWQIPSDQITNCLYISLWPCKQVTKAPWWEKEWEYLLILMGLTKSGHIHQPISCPTALPNSHILPNPPTKHKRKLLLSHISDRWFHWTP